MSAWGQKLNARAIGQSPAEFLTGLFCLSQQQRYGDKRHGIGSVGGSVL